MPGTVERYLASMVAHDWQAMADCLTEDVVRVGPFGDTYSGKGEYVAFLSALMPTLPGYRLELGRVVYADDGGFAAAELTETIELDGTPLHTAEGLLFDLEGDRISHIAIYLRQPGPAPRLAAAPAASGSSGS
jgi:hypothetical protein